jgi:hypothetical protein
LTARVKVTSPESFVGEVQFTVHARAFEFECVTSPADNWALVPGFEKVPSVEARLKPPWVPEGVPEPPIERA